VVQAGNITGDTPIKGLKDARKIYVLCFIDEQLRLYISGQWHDRGNLCEERAVVVTSTRRFGE
jgi:hypothetical protein